MATPASSEPAHAQRHVTPRAATLWLFSHLCGLRDVRVPDTALFDEEGVLATWLHVHPVYVSAKQPKKNKVGSARQQSQNTRESVVISTRGFLDLNLLRLEAHLQDLHQHGPVAVLYEDDQPVALTVEALDITIRALCKREQCLTTAHDSSVSRAYPGGPFVLQAAVHPGSAETCSTIVTRITVKTDGITFTHGLKDMIEDDEAVEQALRRLDLSRACEMAEVMGCAVLQHLARQYKVSVVSLTLESVWTGETQGLVLTCARRVEWVESTATTKLARRVLPSSDSTNTEPETAGRSRHSHHRVCRQCRAPVELELSRELLQKQTMLRSVLTKYQELTERHADTATRCAAALTHAAQQRETIDRLVAEAVALRERVCLQEQAVGSLEDQKKWLVEQLSVANARTEEVKLEVEQANTRMQELVVRQLDQLGDVQQKADVQVQQCRNHDSETQEMLKKVQDELAKANKANRKLQMLYEEAKASCEEMQFQWTHVVRKLTDVSERGVDPAKRVAGGFSSYPTPSVQNVEHVVKWIVDYEAKRTVLEAQQQKHRPSTSVKRKLRMKVELMRLLANGATQMSGSPSRRRRKSSRSPHKKVSAPVEQRTLLSTPRREDPKDIANVAT